MARKTKAERRLAALQAQNKNLRGRIGKKRTHKHRRRSGGGGMTGGGSIGGKLKAAASPMNLALAIVGAVGARAIYGYLEEKMPDQSDGLKLGIATAALPVLAAAGKLKLAIVQPLAAGAVAIAAVDKLGSQIANSVAGYSPQAAQAILTGMGGTSLINTPTVTAAATPTLTAAQTQAALAEGYTAADLTPQPAGNNTLADAASEDASAALSGVGSVAMIRLVDQLNHMSSYN